MGKTTGIRINIYIRDRRILDILHKASRKTGKSYSSLLEHAFAYWINNNPKDLKEMAKEFIELRNELEAKNKERDTGDFIGSFEKEDSKIARIKDALRKGNISSELAKKMMKETHYNYSVSRASKVKRIHKISKKKVPMKISDKKVKKCLPFKECQKVRCFGRDEIMNGDYSRCKSSCDIWKGKHKK